MAGQALNTPAEIPPELDRWNWGAFFLNWIWGLANSTFIALLMFVPVVNIVMIFVLGARGSRWAWRNNVWRDAEQFRHAQRKWAIAGFIVWILGIAFVAAIVLAVPMLMKSSGAYQMTMTAVQSDQHVRDALGDESWPAGRISGSVQTENSAGSAKLSIPVSGSKGSGTAYSEATRSGGQWTITLLYVVIDGTAEPLVLINPNICRHPESRQWISERIARLVRQKGKNRAPCGNTALPQIRMALRYTTLCED